jgi:HK97 family phage major capsid protein
MPYADVVSRTDAQALIPEKVASEIVDGFIEKSICMNLMETQDMGTAQTRIPVLSVLPQAYWLTGASLDLRDRGIKQTTEQAWSNVYLNAEEMAVIVVIPNAVLADTSVDLWAKIKKRVTEAFAIKFDDTVFFGTDAPASFPTAIVPAAVAAGNQVIAGTSTVDLIDDINNVFAAVEADGFEVTGAWGATRLRARLRGIRDADRQFLFGSTGGGGQEVSSLFGAKLVMSRAGLAGFSTGAANYSLVAGDFRQAIVGVRQDLTFQMFTEGVITDAAGVIQTNLMQQDSTALRCVARWGWAVPNPINRLQPVAASRYPFGVLKQRVTTGGE